MRFWDACEFVVILVGEAACIDVKAQMLRYTNRGNVFGGDTFVEFTELREGQKGPRSTMNEHGLVGFNLVQILPNVSGGEFQVVEGGETYLIQIFGYVGLVITYKFDFPMFLR